MRPRFVIDFKSLAPDLDGQGVERPSEGPERLGGRRLTGRFVDSSRMAGEPFSSVPHTRRRRSGVSVVASRMAGVIRGTAP